MSDNRQRKHILFVINPIAGGKDKTSLRETILFYFEKKNIHSSFYFTTGKEDYKELKKIFSPETTDAVVAVGGDGTVNLAGKLLVGTRVPLGIVPHGSANGLAKELGIPEELEGSLNLIRKFRTHPIDTLKINGHDCFHLCDFGYNARVVHRFAESVLRGKISYVWYGMQEFFTFRPFSYHIRTPLLEYKGKAFMIIITNVHKMGMNVNINPLGEIDDGLFEITIIKPFSRFLGPFIFKKLRKGELYKSRYNKIIKCREAVIFNKDNESFHIDGEPVNLGEKIEVKIVPKGLYILRP
jgi:diacylglycerol kinase (ATP)